MLVLILSALMSLFVVVRVWNEAAAHRLTTLGHSVKRGDLVWTQGGQNKPEDSGESSPAQVEILGEVHVLFFQELWATLSMFVLLTFLLIFQIHVVTDQEEERGVYSLGQV